MTRSEGAKLKHPGGVKCALLSVFDKTGIADFARLIHTLGFTIISTGGTAKVLEDAGVPYIPIQDITGNPESFDGRMKTISFRIESGILFDRSNSKHVKEAKELNIEPIDLVVCNLYPFEQKQTIENIDVGGPTMVRAAAKNFKHVLVVVDPDDYQRVGEALASNTPSVDIRKSLAAKAFAHISIYDAMIAHYLGSDPFPQTFAIPGRKIQNLRYGENPHQSAALYVKPNEHSLFEHLQKHCGRDLSLVNITDINAGIASVRMFEKPAAVVIKHNSPCGIALGETLKEALRRAIEADPESAFGGIIVLNKPVDLAAAKIICAFKDQRRGNIDILAIPSISEDILVYLQQVRKSMGVYTFGELAPTPARNEDIKFIDGGFVLQTGDYNIEEGFKDWEIVTKKKPSAKQTEQMQIAWKFISRIKSNAVIVIDKKLPMTRGIGSGQTSRIRSTKIALSQAGKFNKGAILASDSFFPFDDSVKLAAEHGIGTIIQQGGSINDKASIEAANKAGIPMVFTLRRAFWH